MNCLRGMVREIMNEQESNVEMREEPVKEEEVAGDRISSLLLEEEQPKEVIISI